MASELQKGIVITRTREAIVFLASLFLLRHTQNKTDKQTEPLCMYVSMAGNDEEHLLRLEVDLTHIIIVYNVIRAAENAVKLLKIFKWKVINGLLYTWIGSWHNFS